MKFGRSKKQRMTRREYLLAKFKELFPGVYKDGMAVSENTDNAIWINPTPGKRGKRYLFVYRPGGSYELKYI